LTIPREINKVKMSQKSITNFLMTKRPADKSDGDSIASKISKSNIEETSKKAVTASLKTGYCYG
jgi:hypothetical protein